MLLRYNNSLSELGFFLTEWCKAGYIWYWSSFSVSVGISGPAQGTRLYKFMIFCLSILWQKSAYHLHHGRKKDISCQINYQLESRWMPCTAQHHPTHPTHPTRQYTFQDHHSVHYLCENDWILQENVNSLCDSHHIPLFNKINNRIWQEN